MRGRGRAAVAQFAAHGVAAQDQPERLRKAGVDVSLEALEPAVRRREVHDRQVFLRFSGLEREDELVDAVVEDGSLAHEPRRPIPQRKVGPVGDLCGQRRITDLEGEVPYVRAEVVELLQARVAHGAGQVQREGQVVAQVAEHADRSREVREVALGDVRPLRGGAVGIEGGMVDAPAELEREWR